MKNTMVGMLPPGTYVLARLDGTPYSQSEYEMLLRDFEALATSAKKIDELERADTETLAQVRHMVDLLRNENSKIRDNLIIECGYQTLLKEEIEELRATVASQAKRLEELESDRTKKNALLRQIESFHVAAHPVSTWARQALFSTP